MICPKCGRVISDKSRFCKFCGADIYNKTGIENQEGNKGRRIVFIIVAAAVVLSVIAGVLLYRHYSDSESGYDTGDIRHSEGIETPDVERDYTVEDGNMYIPIPEITYDDGTTGTPDNCRVYINGQECLLESGYITLPDDIQEGLCSLRLEWENDGEEYFCETDINLDTISSENWRDAFIEYIQYGTEIENPWGYCLIYLDDNDIPELVEVSNSEAEGVVIVNYADGETKTTNLWRRGFTYIERGNLLNNGNGNMGYYYDKIYSIVDGEMKDIAMGEYEDEENSGTFDYKWNGKSVSESEYESKFAEIYDESKAVEGFNNEALMSAEEMIDELGYIYDETSEITSRDKTGEEFAEYLRNYIVGTWKEKESAIFERTLQFYDDGTYYCKESHDFMGDAEYWGYMESYE